MLIFETVEKDLKDFPQVINNRFLTKNIILLIFSQIFVVYILRLKHL